MLDAGLDSRMVVGDRALGLAKIPSGDKERHEGRNAFFELWPLLGEMLFDLPQEPQRQLVACLEQAPQDRSGANILPFLDLIDYGPLDRVLMRPPDRLDDERGRVTPVLVVECGKASKNF